MRLIAGIVLAGLGMAVAALGLPSAAAAQGVPLAQGRCAEARDLRLVNGRIHTLDARNTIASEVTIQDGKFTAVGRPGGNVGNAGNAGNLDPCTRTIDLGGRTIVPGLIDNHNHIVLLGMRPGHDLRLETATSIADVQRMLRARAAAVPRGEFITTLGDWNAVHAPPA